MWIPPMPAAGPIANCWVVISSVEMSRELECRIRWFQQHSTGLIE